MARRLAKGEETVKLEVKLPSSLKKRAVTMAAGFGDGDLASWLREVIRCEWVAWQKVGSMSMADRELALLMRGKR